jgi:monothiol glutaredoxin
MLKLFTLLLLEFIPADGSNLLDRGAHFSAFRYILRSARSGQFATLFDPSLRKLGLGIGQRPRHRSHLMLSWLGRSSKVEDPHTFLGVDRSATKEQIKSAFRQRAKVLHPDVSELMEDESSERFRSLIKAYDEVMRLSRLPKPPQLDIPEGLSANERVQWLISKNKVILFMRGTKQMPSDWQSEVAVGFLSVAAFDTKQRFAAFNLDTDSEIADAVIEFSGLPAPPICFIDGTLISGNSKLEELYESGELRTLFGGGDDNPPCPQELMEWRAGRWQEPEDWADRCAEFRVERNPNNAALQWVRAKQPPRKMIEDTDAANAVAGDVTEGAADGDLSKVAGESTEVMFM